MLAAKQGRCSPSIEVPRDAVGPHVQAADATKAAGCKEKALCVRN